jgi:chloramphenicol 3-O-phosphotransferase
MPSNNLPARRSSLFGSLSTDRATGKQLATIQTGAFLERAQDEALRNLVVAKMADIGLATHHALEEGDEIVRDVVRRLQQNEFGGQALASLGEEGIRALKAELRRLTEGGF